MGMISLQRIVATGQLLGGMPDSGTPFVWRKPDGTMVATAAAGGLEGLKDSIDMMEAQAKTDQNARESLEYHKSRGDLIKHALLEANSVMESNQFAGHTQHFITALNKLVSVNTSSPTSAYTIFKGSLNSEVYHLLNDIKPYKIIRNTATLNLEDGLNQQKALSTNLLEAHFVPTGGILAAFDPPYYRNWGRDASIAFNEMLQDQSLDDAKEALFDKHIDFDQVFREHAKQLNFPGGLGEARYNIYGYMPYGPWGTPQFDSPALKVTAFSNYGGLLLKKGEQGKVQQKIYPAVKEYLDYLIQNDGKPCFDPWEEINAERHFWTEMTKAVAFRKGGDLAAALGENDDAAKYKAWSGKVIQDGIYGCFFQDANDRVIYPHYHVLNPGSAGKHSILDAQVLGGILHGGEIGYPVQLDHPYALHTLSSILSTFKDHYPINWNGASPAIAVGRYPDDQYGGPDAMGKGGNPWIIATLWSGRYFYELGAKYAREEKIDLTDGRKADLEKLVGFGLPDGQVLSKSDPAFQAVVKKLGERGDGVMQWTLDHTRDSGMSEQIDRNTGQPASVLDLAWSHVAFLETLRSKGAFDEALGVNLPAPAAK